MRTPNFEPLFATSRQGEQQLAVVFVPFFDTKKARERRTVNALNRRIFDPYFRLNEAFTSWRSAADHFFFVRLSDLRYDIRCCPFFTFRKPHNTASPVAV